MTFSRRDVGPRRFQCHPIRIVQVYWILFFALLFSTAAGAASQEGAETIEIVSHAWRPDVVWEKIGKTKFVWNAVVRNRSDTKKRVFVYYDLLDEANVPLASNVANKMVDPGQTVNIVSDSYINSTFLPQVKNSRAIVKLGFPN